MDEEIERLHIDSMKRHQNDVKEGLILVANSSIGKKLGFSLKDAAEIGNEHDADKLDPHSPHYESYIIISGYYENVLDPEEYPYTPELDAATQAHISEQTHHPESWDANWKPIPVKSWEQRRSTIQAPADGSGMDIHALVEMCADWRGQGILRGNTAKSWADRCRHDGRYLFQDDQWKLIYAVLFDIDIRQ